MATVQELLVKITGDASNFTKAIEETKNAGTQVGSAFEKVGSTISSIGTAATGALTVPIVGAATTAVNKFAEVDKTMQLTNKTMGNSAQEAQLLDKAMKEAAANSTFGMNDAATASLNFARAGLNAQEAASALAPAMNLAAGEGGNLDTVSAGLTATINGFGDSFSKAENYADVFAAACNKSALDVDSLSSAMSVAAPIFSAAGYAVEDAALYMGTMANAGIPASEAANSLKTGLARLISPAKEGSVWMEALGINIVKSDGTMKDSVTVQKELHNAFADLSEEEKIAAASAIFGKNQMSKWLALIETAPEDVVALSNELNNCSGTTKEMADTMMGGFGGSIESLKSSIDVLMTSLGELLAGYLSPIIGKIQGVVDKLNGLSNEEKTQLIHVAGLIAALGPLLLVFGKITTVIGTIITSFSKIAPLFSTVGEASGIASAGLTGIASAAGILVAGIALIGGAVYSMIQSFGGVQGLLDEIKGHVDKFINGIKSAVDKFGLTKKIDKLKEKLSGLGDSLGGLKSLWQILFTAIEKVATVMGTVIIGAISGLVDALSGVISIVTGVINILGGLADIIVGVLTGDMERAGQGFSKIWEGIKNVVSGAVNFIKGIVGGFVDAIKGFFSGLKYALIGDPIVIDMWNGIKKVFSESIKKVVDGVKQFVENIKEFFTKMKDKVVEIVTNLKDKTTEKFNDLKDKVKDKVTELKDKAIEKFNSLKQDATNKFEEMKTNVVSKVDNIKSSVTEKFENIKSNISTKVNDAKTAVQNKFEEIKTGISSKLSEAVSTVQNKASEIKNNISNKMGEAAANAHQQFDQIKNGISSKMAEAVGYVQQNLSHITNAFNGINLTSIGSNIISGLLNGLKSAWNAVSTWVNNACKTIKDSFAKAMKIGSPSKVFYQYGSWIDQGLVNGLSSGFPDITRAINGMSDVVSTNFNVSLEGEANDRNTGNTTVNLNGDYMFNDKESMDYFLNRLGLALNRI